MKLRATSCVPINAKGYYTTSLMHISEIKILRSLPLIILVLIFVNVKTLIMLMLFLEQAAGDLLGPCGRPGARGHHVGDPCSTLLFSHISGFQLFIICDPA